MSKVIARDNRSGQLYEGIIKNGRFVVESGPEYDPTFDIFDLSEVTIGKSENIIRAVAPEVCGLPEDDAVCKNCEGCRCKENEDE